MPIYLYLLHSWHTSLVRYMTRHSAMQSLCWYTYPPWSARDVRYHILQPEWYWLIFCVEDYFEDRNSIIAVQGFRLTNQQCSKNAFCRCQDCPGSSLIFARTCTSRRLSKVPVITSLFAWLDSISALEAFVSGLWYELALGSLIQKVYKLRSCGSTISILIRLMSLALSWSWCYWCCIWRIYPVCSVQLIKMKKIHIEIFLSKRGLLREETQLRIFIKWHCVLGRVQATICSTSRSWTRL